MQHYKLQLIIINRFQGTSYYSVVKLKGCAHYGVVQQMSETIKAIFDG